MKAARWWVVQAVLVAPEGQMAPGGPAQVPPQVLKRRARLAPPVRLERPQELALAVAWVWGQGVVWAWVLGAAVEVALAWAVALEVGVAQVVAEPEAQALVLAGLVGEEEPRVEQECAQAQRLLPGVEAGLVAVPTRLRRASARRHRRR